MFARVHTEGRAYNRPGMRARILRFISGFTSSGDRRHVLHVRRVRRWSLSTFQFRPFNHRARDRSCEITLRKGERKKREWMGWQTTRFVHGTSTLRPKEHILSRRHPLARPAAGWKLFRRVINENVISDRVFRNFRTTHNIPVTGLTATTHDSGPLSYVSCRLIVPLPGPPRASFIVIRAFTYYLIFCLTSQPVHGRR